MTDSPFSDAIAAAFDRLAQPSAIHSLAKAEMTVRKVGYETTISREMALDFGLVEPTPEEAEYRAQERAEWAERRRIGYEETKRYLAALDAITDPITRKVLDLHSRDHIDQCAGCDFAGYESEPPAWPCQTVELIADHHFIATPSLVTFEEPK